MLRVGGQKKIHHPGCEKEKGLVHSLQAIKKGEIQLNQLVFNCQNQGPPMIEP